MKRLAAILTLLAASVQAEPAVVLTDIPPVHSLVSQVMGDLREPNLLLKATDDVHHMQLRPSQAHAMADADIVFWVGPDLEPWLGERLITANPQVISVQLEHGDEKASEHEEHDHVHGIHPWLDPAEASVWLDVIAHQLAAIDPMNREIYVANAARAQAQLAALTADIQRQLAPLAGTGFVVGHDAYGGFADRFGLTILASLRDSEDQNPGAAALAEVRNLVASGDVACIFTDVGHSTAFVHVVDPDANIPVGELDPMGINLLPGREFYHDLLDSLAKAFTNCK